MKIWEYIFSQASILNAARFVLFFISILQPLRMYVASPSRTTCTVLQKLFNFHLKPRQLSVPEITVTHLLPYLLTTPLCGEWNDQRSEPDYWLCLSVAYYSAFYSAGFAQVSNFPPPYRWGDFVTIIFWITLQFLLRDATEQVKAIRSACSRAFWLLQIYPAHANILGRV